MDWTTLKHTLSPKQRFNRDVLWNVASLVVLGVSGIALYIIIGKYRGAAALGVFNQVYAIYIVLSQLAVGGVHASVLKHVSHNQGNAEKCSHITSTALLLALLLSGLVCLAAYFGKAWAGRFLDSPGVAAGMTYAIPGLLFFSLNKILLNVLNGARNMRAFAVFNALRFILILITLIVIIAAGMSADCLPLGFTVAEVFLFVGLMVYVNAHLFVLRVPAALRDWLAEHLSFGYRGMLNGLVSDLNSRVDVLMLGYFCADEHVGVYTMAATVAEGFFLLPVALQRNLNPIIGKYFAEGDIAKIQDVARRMRRITHAGMAMLGLAAALAFPLLIGLFFPDRSFSGSWPVFCILAVGIVIYSGYALMDGILSQGGRPGAHTLLMFCTVTGNAVLNAALIPSLGIIGAATATACAYVLQAALLLTFTKRIFGIRLWR